MAGTSGIPDAYGDACIRRLPGCRVNLRFPELGGRKVYGGGWEASCRG